MGGGKQQVDHHDEDGDTCQTHNKNLIKNGQKPQRTMLMQDMFVFYIFRCNIFSRHCSADKGIDGQRQPLVR